MNDNKAPCNRCKARGLPCTVNKSLQMLLENDVSWKEKMEGRMGQLEQALRQSTNQPSTVPSFSVNSSGPSQGSAGLEADRSSIAPPTPWVISSNVTLNLSCSLGAFPASSMISLTLTDAGGHSGQTSDLVSCGLIPHNEAEDFFAFYKQNLNPCIHHILTESDTFPIIRARSPLLLAAICTVSALCTGSKHYAPILKYFTTQVSGKVFSSRHTFDDVRALCIGALWLNEVSTALNSLGTSLYFTPFLSPSISSRL
ncbi:hypothetical protein N7510_011044 [Penicillium lagena]|uniref:uncharacterized protein n=1 Tax=Penicillium lagena TaxID=94218 RepID=UPI0025422359|nr:uncharacterized protein N7510_011044 [Penicillium lagena]KAJ5601510.1 hypothetical protein N7510_011044 [Penicillium lagena]